MEGLLNVCAVVAWDYSMGMAGMVAKRGQMEELLNSGKDQRGVGMHDLLWLTHSRQPLSLIRAVGLPQMCTGCSVFCTTALLVPLSVLSRPNVARHMRIRHDIISGSFLFDDKHT